MMSEKKSNLHIFLLVGAFILALAFRLIRLGLPGLSDMEADFALQALRVARDSETQFGGQIAYVGLTGFSFFLLTAGNFLARLWPAFVGALIVFLPFLFRKWVGHWPAAILSFVLAISPEMVGLSRIVGSPMMAFVFLLLALGFLFNQKPILTGICLALSLMSGSTFWVGLLILGLSFLISTVLFKVSDEFSIDLPDDKRGYWLRLGMSFAMTILVVGTGFFLNAGSLSGIFNGLIEFLKGFVTPNEVPIGLILLTLAAYTIEAVIFGIWGGLRGLIARSKLDMFLFVWSGLGLIFLLLYPAAESADMIWMTLPLWSLSVRVACFAWRTPKSSKWMLILTAVLVVVVSAFILFTLRSLVGTSLDEGNRLTTFLALVGGLVLLLAIVILISYGWSEEVALPGLLLGLAVVFGLGLVSVSVNSTGLAPEKSAELWFSENAVLLPEMVEVTIERVMIWNARVDVEEAPVDIAVSDYDTPGMRWILRDYAEVDFVPYLAAQSQPGILITDAQESPEIANSYTGQDLVWSETVLWEEMTSFQYLSWLITRDAPTSSSEIIFWVRTDLVPNDQLNK